MVFYPQASVLCATSTGEYMELCIGSSFEKFLIFEWSGLYGDSFKFVYKLTNGKKVICRKSFL